MNFPTKFTYDGKIISRIVPNNTSIIFDHWNVTILIAGAAHTWKLTLGWFQLKFYILPWHFSMVVSHSFRAMHISWHLSIIFLIIQPICNPSKLCLLHFCYEFINLTLCMLNIFKKHLHFITFQHTEMAQAFESFPYHYDIIKWKHLQRYWPFVRGIHQSPVNSTHKGPVTQALMFS